jgi:hypothetical protein
VEKIQLQAMEVFRREFLLILAAAVFVLRVPHGWALAVLTGIRQLASVTTGTDYDRRRFYLFLDGVRRTMRACSLLDRCVNALPPGERLPNLARAPN